MDMNLNEYREYVSTRESMIEEENKKNAEKANDMDSYYESRILEKERKEKLLETYSNFKHFVKDTLLAEAVKSLFVPAVNLDEDSKNYVMNEQFCNAYVTNFINEQDGSDMIFMRNKSNTYFIEFLKETINKHYNIIMESVDKDEPENYKIDKNNLKDFLDDLGKDDDYNSIKDAIRNRVINAEEEFLANAMADKKSMEQIMDNTTTKIEAIKADENILNTAKEEIEQEAVMMMKQKMQNVRDRKGKSILEVMVERMSEKIYKGSMKEQYVNESGKLDVGGVLETAKCVYSLIEALSTSKLVKIDEEFIENYLNNI